MSLKNGVDELEGQSASHGEGEEGQAGWWKWAAGLYMPNSIGGVILKQTEEGAWSDPSAHNGPLADCILHSRPIHGLGLDPFSSHYCVLHDSSPPIFATHELTLTRQPTATNSQLKPNHPASLSLWPERVSGLLPALHAWWSKVYLNSQFYQEFQRNTM